MSIVHIAPGLVGAPGPEVIGAKAANLARMAALGLSVPPAFVLPVSLCAAVVRGEPGALSEVRVGLEKGIAFLERETGRRFGDSRRPLLVSVRSGAARSMPGMLETVLDVGCTSAAVRGLIRLTGNPRFAWDCRRRFLESFGSVVLGVEERHMAGARANILSREASGAWDGEALERYSGELRQLIEAESDGDVSDEPLEQLSAAAQAVYRSWNSSRAAAYRALEHLEDLEGTAVTVQAMVFGNAGPTSGAGVAFSRDPSSGARTAVIDVVFEAQGEDVVSGSRTPETEEALARIVPDAARELRQTLVRLEREFGDVQDVEFTVEGGRLWILQTRAAKRTPLAAVRFALDLLAEGHIPQAEALKRIEGVDLEALSTRRLRVVGPPLAEGRTACGGVAVGRAAFDSESAVRFHAGGEPVILVRPDTSTADVVGFSVASGIVTAVGGRTAHAALVARQMGKPCIVGCAALQIDGSRRIARVGGRDIAEGDFLCLNADAGALYEGRGEIISERPERELAAIAALKANVPAEV